MGFLSYGTGKALNYTNDFQKDIDRLYQREAYRAQVEAEKQQKTRFYSSLMKEQTATAPYNTKRLEELYSNLHTEIADYAINNPDWETNVVKNQEMMSKMDKFINNPFIREDQEVQQQWEATKKAYGENKLKQSEYEALAEKYYNYTQNGGDPYVFANPKRKEMPEILRDINQWLEPEITKETDPITGLITKRTKTSDINIHMAAVMGLRDPDIDFVIDQKYNEIPPEDKGLYRSKTEYFEYLIRAGEISAEEDAGYDQMKVLERKASLDKNSDLSNYHRFYLNQVYEPLRTNGETSADLANISFTEFGAKGQPIATGPNGRNFKIYDSKGNATDINIRGNIVSVGAGKIIDKNGVAWVQTQVMVSLNDDQPLTDSEGKPIMRDMTEEEMAREKKIRGDKAKYEQVAKGQMATTLQENGFNVSKVTDQGMLASLGLEGSTITSDVYVGTILMPADFSEANRIRYDTFYSTKENIIKGVELYDENINALEVLGIGPDGKQVRQANTPVASSLINSKVSKNISTQLGRNVGNLAWSQSQEDPFTWMAEDEDNYYKFDFNTNEWFHKAK